MTTEEVDEKTLEQVQQINKKLEVVKHQVGNLVYVRASLRPLKPKEVRATVLETAKETVKILNVELEPRIAMLADQV